MLKFTNVSLVIVVSDEDLSESRAELNVNIEETSTHYSKLEIPVQSLQCSYVQLEEEPFEIALNLVSNIKEGSQIVFDCTYGERYLRFVIQQAVHLTSQLYRVITGQTLKCYELVRKPGFEKQFQVFNTQSHRITLPHLKVLEFIEPQVGEKEIAKYTNLTQSTVNSHIKTLRKLGLVEGKTLKARDKTSSGKLIFKVYNALKRQMLIES